MTKRQQVIALLALGWSFRRIQRETGVRRETVSRYSRPVDPKPAKVFPGERGSPGPENDPEAAEEAVSSPAEGSNPAKVFPGPGANAAKAFPGSGVPPRSTAAPYRDAILEKLGQGLTVQRVFQDLQEEYGYVHSYESVKRYVRKLERPRRAVGVMHTIPGEAQVDFFQGPPTLDESTGQRRRPWVFRMTLCHSRHGYEEAVWDRKVATFLRLHENAFRDLCGVVRVIRHDNLKAAVVRACLYDPDCPPGVRGLL